jgi:hypothetical protein
VGDAMAVLEGRELLSTQSPLLLTATAVKRRSELLIFIIIIVPRCRHYFF